MSAPDAGAAAFRSPPRLSVQGMYLCGCDASGAASCVVGPQGSGSLPQQVHFPGTRCLLMTRGHSAECVVPPTGNARCTVPFSQIEVGVRMGSLGAEVLGDDEVRADDTDFFYVSAVRRFYVHADLRLNDRPVPEAVDLERVIRLPEAPTRFASNASLICFLYPGGRPECWSHWPSRRRRPVRMDRGEVATSLATGNSCAAVGTASGKVLVFGTPGGSEGFGVPWNGPPSVRLLGASGPSDDLALVYYRVYSISGRSLYWWEYQIANGEPRVRRPEGTCDLGAEGLRFVRTGESSSLICVHDAGGRFACNAEPTSLCGAAGTRFR